jgi:ATP-binding cassette, subfamily C, bacterial CydC
LLAPVGGEVTLDNTPLDAFKEDELRCAVSFFAEDAHIFATTVRENLLVARGDCPDHELTFALRRVGLDPWLTGLPDGLDTALSAGAQALSAGQRRRLLLARALISPARIVLLDEPTEHLDAADAGPILTSLLTPDGGLFDAGRTVVVATHHLPNDLRFLALPIATDGYAD